MRNLFHAFDGELQKWGESYPILCEGAPQKYFFFRPTVEIEAVDLVALSKIEPKYQPGMPYKLISRKKVMFISENIKDLLIFKDKYQTAPKDIYYGEAFMDIVKKNNVTGIDKDSFKPIWPRELRNLETAYRNS